MILKEKSVYPIYPTHPHKEDPDKILKLLYIEDEITKHFVYISDFDRLMSNFTKHKGKKHFCLSCLQCFYSTDSLARHRSYCIAINGMQAIVMPEKYKDKNGVERSPCVYFKNHQNSLPVPFEIVGDFEANTEKISSCQPSDKKSYTEKISKTYSM